MLRTILALLIPALLISTQAIGQETELGNSTTTPPAEEASPAPGEPGGADTSSPGEDSPERYQRTPDPIGGAKEEAASPTDDFDAQAAIEALRADFESRLKEFESRLDEQITRVDALADAKMTIAENDGETVTTNKPTDEESVDPRDAEIVKLKGELEKLRGEYGELFVAITDHSTAINNHAEGLKRHEESIKSSEKELTDTKQLVADLQSGQETLAAQVRDDAMASPAADGSSPQVLGNMQPSRALQYRLRIHNTTGAEQPISVNGVQWTVRGDEWTFVPVPNGPITVHRPGYAPLEVPADPELWERDERGHFVNYEYEGNRVGTDAAKAE